MGVVNAKALWQSDPSQLKGEFTMSFKKATVAALLAASMSSAPVLAQTASASSLSVAARAGESTESASELRGGFVIPLIAVVAVILGILAATSGGSEPPRSP